jgi:hypothetical protein
MKFNGTTIGALTAIPALNAAGDFQLHRVHLVRAGCPVTLLGTKANQMTNMPIVIAANREKHGYVASTNYYPKAVVVAGADTRSKLLANSVLATWAWIEAGSMDVKEAPIGTGEIMQKLTAALAAKYIAAVGLPSQEVPWLAEVFPFENVGVFCFKGQKYQQRYILSNADRTVTLAGSPERIDGSIDACISQMPRSQTGARWYAAPVAGNNQTSTMGGVNSELVTQIVRNWDNINEAANMYVNAIQNGLHSPMQPSFAPVALPKDGKIATTLASRRILPADFAVWSEAAQQKDTKMCGGKEVHRKHFAYVGKKSDPSTWRIPLDTPDHIKAAVDGIDRTQGIPDNKKLHVFQRITKAYAGCQPCQTQAAVAGR